MPVLRSAPPFVAAVAAVAAPGQALAAILTACDIVAILNRAAGYLTSIILVVAITMLLWAAVLFMTGGGNEEKIKGAKALLIYVLVGLVVAFLSTQADDLVKNLFGSTFVVRC